MSDDLASRGDTPGDGSAPPGESELRFRSVADAAPMPMWTIDADGRATFANKAWLDFTGHTLEYTVRGGWADALDPDDVARIRRLLAQILETRVPFEVEFRLRRHDGEHCWMVARNAPWYGPDGSFLGVVGSSFDITKRRRTEEALRTSERELRMLLDAMSDEVLVVDRDGRYREVPERTTERVPHRPPQSLPGRRLSEVLPSDRAEEFLFAVRRSLDTKSPVDLEYPVEISGHRYWFHATLAPVGEDAAVIVARDISGRKQAEETLRRLNADLERRIAERTAELESTNRALEQVSRHKSEFLANMSHELRTPLNGIIGFAELIHDGRAGPVTATQVEYLGDVLTSARHLLQMLNDVLDLAKVESGRQQFAPETVRLAPLVDSVRAALRPTAETQGITVTTWTDSSLGEVVADPQRLTQVLFNYLSNALKHTPPGGRVEIRTAPEGADHFRVEVEDSGTGIRAEDIQRLFKDFEQIRASGARVPSGAGLGLALTRRIVEAQGGTVGVRSEFGRGSVFWAVLPRGGARGEG